MSKKQNLQKNPQNMGAQPPQDESDDDLEYKPYQSNISQHSVSGKKSAKLDGKIEEKIPIPYQSGDVYTQPPKKKRNLTEEHKEALRERLKIAHQRKKELAEQRALVRQEEEENHLAKKQLAILEQARLIKQKQKKELNAIKSTPVETKKKQAKIVYVEESDESEEEEEVIIKKKKTTNKAPVQNNIPPVVPHTPVSNFQFRFI